MAAPAPIVVHPLATSTVFTGALPAIAAYGPFSGGIIVNPQAASDQGIGEVEILYVDVTGPAALEETATTQAIQPGGLFTFVPGQATNVWVNAATSGHRFSGYVLQAPAPFPPTPQPGPFPPDGPVTLTDIIPSYLYQQYADDDDLQAFVASYNEIAQSYASWFASGALPVYTSDAISGALLDWVAEGLYGMKRPALSSGRNRDVGPFNTWRYNTLGYNVRRNVGPADVTVTTDDIFKRIMTWNFYKGDGNAFNVRWLKRRVMRFLIGENGSAPNVEQTYAISVTFGPGIISIRLSSGTRRLTGGAVYGGFRFNQRRYNERLTEFASGPAPLPFSKVFKQAMDSGALTVPFQYDVRVTISGG